MNQTNKLAWKRWGVGITLAILFTIVAAFVETLYPTFRAGWWVAWVQFSVTYLIVSAVW